ncbi:MAG: lipid II:glycine glycyltransferase FemX [Bacteroidota bacterium]
MHPWNALISTLPGPHLLQTYEWGHVKARYGWSPFYAAWDTQGGFHMETDASRLAPPTSTAAAAMILKRTILRSGLARRLSILYAPKGPLLDWRDPPLRARVLADLQLLARKQGAIFLKIDPDVVQGRGSAEPDPDGRQVTAELAAAGWIASADQVQFRNTILIDVSRTEEGILAAMKQKTRYNIRLAARKGVTVRTGTRADLSMLYRMYAATSVRDGFVIRDENYYRTVWQAFMQADSPRCEPLIAEVEGQPVAAIFIFMFAGRAYYLYGMSSGAHREKMPAYLLQWEAIRRAKAAGCSLYDLWGAPDEFEEKDRMWGVYRFKEGFGGEVIRTAGAWDYAPSKLWYKIYTEVMPRLIDLMRSRGRERTRQSLE